MLEISEQWYRRMAGQALSRGLADVASSFHERAVMAAARLADLRHRRPPLKATGT